MHYCLLALAILFCGSHAQTIVITTQIVTAPSSTPTSSPQYTSDADFQSAILNSTNFFRTEHNATAVTWNASLANYATNYVNNCQFQHSGGPYGENLAEGYTNVTEAVDAWGNEQADYDYNNPGFSEQTGHFTQLVWKATTTVGCGRSNCNGDNGLTGWYLVCEYYPPGNVIGAFGTEVDPVVDNGGQSGTGGGQSGGGGGQPSQNGGAMSPGNVLQVSIACLLVWPLVYGLLFGGVLLSSV